MILVQHLSRAWWRRFVGILMGLMTIALIAVLLDIHQNASLSALGLSWIGLLVLVQLPYLLTIVLPTASFFAWVLLLSEWSERRMILVMYLCGFDKKRLLIGPLLTASFVFVLCGLCQPLGASLSHLVQNKAQHSWVSETVEQWPSQQFVPLPNKHVMYAESQGKHGNLLGIWWMETPQFKSDHSMPMLRLVHAESAERGKGGALVLKNGRLYEADWQHDNIKIAAFESYHWRLMSPLIWKHWLPSLKELWRDRYVDASARLTLYWQCAWLSMAWVLACWSVWIAGGVHGRMGREFMQSLLVYAGYLASLAGGAHLVAVEGTFLWWHMIWVPVLSATLALVLLVKQRS